MNIQEENIEEMRARHEFEIAELQKSCKHKDISDWMPYMWAPGHYMSDVRVCNHCGEVREQRDLMNTILEVENG